MELKKVLKKPVITEKATFLASQGGYVFEVDRQATKKEIKKAVEKFFKVTVTQIKTINVAGKKRRLLKTRKQIQGKPWKKALVILKEGEKIDLFETGD
ncbi:50S ribosomal protein L23 [Candidatus Shapirobacteria bacterium]|nr:50S ribosomal protein L23 [Candidatus Shapirobacteria bacterium]